MNLTAKQEAFAQAVASGKTQADSYRLAYNAIKMTDKQIWEKASEVKGNVKVTARVNELKAALADKALWTRQDSVEALKGVAQGVEAKGSEVVAAIKELNSMHGYNEPIKHTIDGSITLIERRLVKAST